ncbi:MAG: DNA polymerase IV [Candidatus Paceibacterota bacterium]|jgi:DNA polymerase-4/DNA polymerase V
MQPLTIHSFPRAILHVDGDAFFASCEVAKDPTLRGKPVVTGLERGIASSMTYEAKMRGVTRAMSLRDIRKICPDVIILPSDYETYSLYSKRMYEIVRRFTSDIEEYSIDECFADLTGMRRPNNMSYEEMAMRIKHDLDTELGMTFSVGLSVNKVLSKIGSKWKKPSGLTIIPGYNIHLYLSKTPVEKIWGIGPNTSAYLNKYGIKTALDFAIRDKYWVRSNLSKPFQEIHSELNGSFVYPLTLGEKHDYTSISKTKTFTPPSSDAKFVFAELSKNIENACIKLRRHDLFAKKFAFFIKNQEFRYSGLEINLNVGVRTPEQILSLARERFGEVFNKGFLYRSTGVILMNLIHDDVSTLDLFGDSALLAKTNKIYEAVDRIDRKYGKHTIFLGSSFRAIKKPIAESMSSSKTDSSNSRNCITERRNHLLKGETARKRLGIPFLGITM